ncbi:MAG: hypothetical protein MUO26_08275 [Methanotrichaceae archaeon]|nr:hypothetical protein [Methanotrichaceae archaeon]
MRASATILPWKGPFLEDLAKIAGDYMFYFEKGPRNLPRLTPKTWQKMKDQKTL